MSLKNFIQNAPATAGIYLMFGSDNSNLYIGKGENIKKRLKNYIGNNLSPRTLLMVYQIN